MDILTYLGMWKEPFEINKILNWTVQRSYLGSVGLLLVMRR